MQDDRDRYLAEIEMQADNGPDYIVAFICANAVRFPWTHRAHRLRACDR